MGLRACQMGLRACQRGLRACQRGLRACQEAGGMLIHTDICKNKIALFLGSGSNRGQSPVEWGEIPYVRTSVRPSVPPSLLRPLWQALRPLWQALRPLWQTLKPLWQALRPLCQALRPLQMKGHMDGQTDR